MRAILVLGCRVGDDGVPGPALTRRLRAAVTAASADEAAWVIVSGGDVHGPNEALAMARWLEGAGVAPERIVLEPRARDTRENAARAVAILESLSDRSPAPAEEGVAVTLVTEAYHLKRSRRLVERALRVRGLDAEVTGLAAPDGRPGMKRMLKRAAERIKGWAAGV